MVMPHSVHRGGTTIGSPRPPEPPAAAPRWRGQWLPAADLPLDDERAATVSFDRRGRCRLTLALDHPATDADVAALEAAADVLPNLHLFDLDDTADYPERHAEALVRWQQPKHGTLRPDRKNSLTLLPARAL